MNPSAPQSDTATGGSHLLLFDGACGLCTSLVQFVLAHDRSSVFDFASLSSPLGRATVARFGGDADDQSTMYVVSDYRTNRARPLIRSSAALFVLDALGWPWRSATLIGVVPTALLDRCYDVVGRNRHRLFDRPGQCLTPREEWRARFVDLREPIGELTGV